MPAQIEACLSLYQTALECLEFQAKLKFIVCVVNQPAIQTVHEENCYSKKKKKQYSRSSNFTHTRTFPNCDNVPTDLAPFQLAAVIFAFVAIISDVFVWIHGLSSFVLQCACPQVRTQSYGEWRCVYGRRLSRILIVIAASIKGISIDFHYVTTLNIQLIVFITTLLRVEFTLAKQLRWMLDEMTGQLENYISSSMNLINATFVVHEPFMDSI